MNYQELPIESMQAMKVLRIIKLVSSSLVHILEGGHDSIDFMSFCSQSWRGSPGTLNSMLVPCVRPLQEPGAFEDLSLSV